MGKLLQKLVHGVVPSWLSKVRSSSHSSPKKLLPFLPAGRNHTSSPTSPSSRPATTTPQDGSSSIAIPPAPRVAAVIDNSNTHQDDCKPIDIAPKSSSVQPQKPQSERSDVDGSHQLEECHVSENVKVSNRRTFQDMLKEDDHCTQSKPAAEQYAHSSKESLKMQGVLQHMEENIHHSQHGVQEAQNDSGYQEKAYEEMVGLKSLKRKRQSPKGDDDEEEEDEGEGVGSREGSDDIKRRAWKRRKREKGGLMSCELPESICNIVGNGRAVVKHSVEPHLALWESMVEMIVGNGLWEVGNLEYLLYCYLSLNEPHLYPIIQSSFLQVLKDLERIT